MNNAAIGPESKSWALLDNWRSIFDVNVFGYVPIYYHFFSPREMRRIVSELSTCSKPLCQYVPGGTVSD